MSAQSGDKTAKEERESEGGGSRDLEPVATGNRGDIWVLVAALGETIPPGNSTCCMVISFRSRGTWSKLDNCK